MPCVVYIKEFVVADIISCVEFNSTGDLLATGDKGGRIVIFQQEPGVSRRLFDLLADNCNFWYDAVLFTIWQI